MGLFDKRDKKRKSDDFDSPVEQIDLSAPAPAETREMVAEPPEPELAPAAATAAAAAAPEPHAARPAPSRAPSPDPYDDGEYDSSFGIQKAIELMRTLPQDNVELVVQVVKLTLESTKIKISHIIDDATRKQDDIQGRIKVLKDEIVDFEREIAQRKEEIGSLEADFKETSTVKDRLQLAEKLTKPESASKTVTSEGRDQAKASGSIGGTGPRPTLGGQPAKTSVVIKK